jgi:hypothetical protein
MEPFAQELLDRARHAHDPGPEDAARVRAKLALRIGAAALATGGSAAAVGRSHGWLLKLVLPSVVVASVLALVLTRGRSPAVETAPVPPAAVSVPVVATAEPTATELPAPTPSDAPVAPANSVPLAAASATAPVRAARPQPSASSDLEAEMALLASAQAAIQRGDFSAALAKLDEHQRSFPGGALSEERTAARVVALCGAGRQSEARALAALFLAHHPSSPLAPRVKNACGAP